ncbi:MAG: 2-amino-4-hydroxy-6-hydroxymethyldihydropteridine diphosphokinase [Victivallales bacterium]|nr:2-amino-4-hydroxy-6-hydroxymethyldihydropteridine diphosphokinase [Victivallales bacterium]
MQVLLGIGSNCNADENIAAAKERLAVLLPGIQFSRVWQFPAAQGGNVPPYSNLAALANTSLSQDELKQQLRCIEAELARNRDTPDSVTIDLDLLAFGNTRSPDLLACDYCRLPASELLVVSG